VFYKKKRGSEHFSASLPLILKGWKLLVPHAPERMDVPSPTRPERMEAPGPTCPERMEVPGPHALKGQKLLAQGIALGMLYASLSP